MACDEAGHVVVLKFLGENSLAKAEAKVWRKVWTQYDKSQFFAVHDAFHDAVPNAFSYARHKSCAEFAAVNCAART
jgi:hypothetical protein